MRIVITGGAGFIGTNLTFRLLREETVDEILVLDDFSTGLRTQFDDTRVSVREGDLRDSQFVEATIQGADRVVHLGALPSVPRSVRDPRATINVNVVGTLNVLEGARKAAVSHVVSASSSSVYGANPLLPKTEDLATQPISPYAASKLATETLTNVYHHTYGIDTIAFRFFNVFGPLQRADHVYAAVIPKFLQALKQNEPLTVFGDGTQSRDFTSVHAVVDTLAEASLKSVSHPNAVNLAFGTRTSLNEVIESLRKIHPGHISVNYSEPRAGDVPHSQASSELLSTLFPNIQAPVFSDALREVYQWYMK